jgi:hypothetical protein
MMRAPNKLPLDDWWTEPLDIEHFIDDAHTEEQWDKVKKILDGVGVDADAVLIDPSLLPHGFAREAVRWSLRDQLPFIIQRCAIDSLIQKRFPTALDLAKEQDRTIGLCRDLLARLGGDAYGEPSKHNRLDPETHWLQFPRLSRLEDRIRTDLEAYIAELERCRNELAATGTSRGKGNRKLHVQFWDALTRIWRDNVGEGVKWDRSNHLAKFLIACSEPFSPEDTTGGAISAYIERLPDSSK